MSTAGRHSNAVIATPDNGLKTIRSGEWIAVSFDSMTLNCHVKGVAVKYTRIIDPDGWNGSFILGEHQIAYDILKLKDQYAACLHCPIKIDLESPKFRAAVYEYIYPAICRVAESWMEKEKIQFYVPEWMVEMLEKHLESAKIEMLEKHLESAKETISIRK